FRPLPPLSDRMAMESAIGCPWNQRSDGRGISDRLRVESLIGSPWNTHLLKPSRLLRKGRGLCSTRPGSLLKSQIPIKTDNWDVTQPGFLEADTVAHCGSSLAGDFVYTVNCVDIFSGWVEQRAIWNKGQEGTLAAVRDIERSLPFELKGFDCDNGSEFLNHHLWKYCSERAEGKKIKFTRSRPYKKDDNAHIEQKNWTHVRQLLGYDRFDKPFLVEMLNDLYKQEWNWYVNFFCPSVKLVSKRRVGSKMVKMYDEPKTPFQRLIECKALSAKDVLRLKLRMKGLNPFELNERIARKVNQILDFPR
ncbi:MAG: transposase family protein, partial [bacterium]